MPAGLRAATVYLVCRTLTSALLLGLETVSLRSAFQSRSTEPTRASVRLL